MKKLHFFPLFFLFLITGLNGFSQVFLYIEGVNGESVAKGHEKETPIESISWGLQNTQTLSSTTGGLTAGKASATEMTFTKTRGTVSSVLQNAVFNGKPFLKAEIRFYKTGVDPLLASSRYLTIFLELVGVTKHEVSGDSEGKPTETFSLVFAKIRTEDAVPNPDGTIKKIPSGWDFTKNALY